MDAKRSYISLVEKVKEQMDENAILWKKIQARNHYQEKFKDLWEKVNLDKVVEKFAPGSKPITNENGKIIFRTPGSHIQVVAEATIGSARIQNLSIKKRTCLLGFERKSNEWTPVSISRIPASMPLFRNRFAGTS